MNSNKNKSGGGFKGLIATGITLVILASGLMGVAKVNNINSVPELFMYFKSYSDKIWECSDGKVQWTCENPLNGGSNGSNTGDKDSVPSKGNATSASGKDESSKKLESIKIGTAQKVNYERSEWKHWTGSPCNTRAEVLKSQGENVKSEAKTCKITSGTWNDPYSGDTFTDASKLDIDHVIPLSYAAQAGGQSWDAAKKEQFANDTSQLLAVSASENRKKSDDGPADYMPKNKDYHCEYSKLWIDTATKYDLTITQKDKQALDKGLAKCGS